MGDEPRCVVRYGRPRSDGGKRAGLVDTKVARFSDTHAAHKFVVLVARAERTAGPPTPEPGAPTEPRNVPRDKVRATRRADNSPQLATILATSPALPWILAARWPSG